MFFNTFRYSCRKMSSYSKIILNIKDKLAVITLNEPKRKNAINNQMYAEVTDALEKLSSNNDVAITAITGAGEFYCSGTDLKSSLSVDGSSIDEATKAASATLRKFVGAFINHKKILVAVVNGPAIGIAVTTLCLCDVVYCSDTATFQTPFTKLGMSAEGCSSYTFPRIMGTSVANEMLLFNRRLTAKEAVDIGLVAQMYTKEQMETILWPQLRMNAAELPLKSLVYSKQLMRKFNEDNLHKANEQECDRLEERWKSEDCLNAILKFVNARSKM